MTEGDLRRFAEMHERHFKQLKVFATRYLGGTCMAEDVVQAAFGQFIPYFDTRKNEEAWLAWLRKAIYRNCLKVWRERQLFRKHTPSVAVDDSVDNSPDRWMEITEDARRNALLV